MPLDQLNLKLWDLIIQLMSDKVKTTVQATKDSDTIDFSNSNFETEEVCFYCKFKLVIDNRSWGRTFERVTLIRRIIATKQRRKWEQNNFSNSCR